MPLVCSGYEGLVKSLLSDLPADIVTYNRPVRCVHWNNTESSRDAVNVECDDGEKISADHVILTVPLGRLLHTFHTILCNFYDNINLQYINDEVSSKSQHLSTLNAK